MDVGSASVAAAATVPAVAPLNLDRLAEVVVTLAAHTVTTAAGTSNPVALATSEQLADLYLIHFLEVPVDLGVSQDFYTGMDTTDVPYLNVGDYQMDDLFS